MSKTERLGIITNPIKFVDGNPLPPNPSGRVTDPQNLWHSIVNQQEWAAVRILGQAFDNIQPCEPYTEPQKLEDTPAKIAEADEQRGGTLRYTTKRNAESLATVIGVNPKALFAELKKATVLDVGSGNGYVANDLRQHAKARVIELDFSSAAFSAAEPIIANRGARIIADGTMLPFKDSSFDNVISMFSTFAHTDTIRGRLSGLTEAIRVTKPGGKVFIAPLSAGTVNRQKRWTIVEDAQLASRLDVTRSEIEDYKQTERQMSAMDFAAYGLLGKLMAQETVSLTPVLKFDLESQLKSEAISAIIEVNEQLSADQARYLIEAEASAF